VGALATGVGLAFAAWAAKSSADSATAAREALAIARKQQWEESRPLLSISEQTVAANLSSGYLSLTLRLQNIGAAPARVNQYEYESRDHQPSGSTMFLATDVLVAAGGEADLELHVDEEFLDQAKVPEEETDPAVMPPGAELFSLVFDVK
jgi:hypothetical protein